MTLRRLLWLVSLLAIALPASAQIDPDPDGIGIYADLGATLTSVTAAPEQPFEVYLMITRPSRLEDIIAWECSLVVPDNAVIWGWNIQGTAWSNFPVRPNLPWPTVWKVCPIATSFT
jgi:hypothetical protein